MTMCDEKTLIGSGTTAPEVSARGTRLNNADPGALAPRIGGSLDWASRIVRRFFMRLAGKVAIVTGVEQDGGRAVAARFLAEGAKVVGACRSLQQGQEALGETGDSAVAIEANPWNVGDAERIVKTAVDRFGRVDILVNSGN